MRWKPLQKRFTEHAAQVSKIYHEIMSIACEQLVASWSLFERVTMRLGNRNSFVSWKLQIVSRPSWSVFGSEKETAPFALAAGRNRGTSIPAFRPMDHHVQNSMSGLAAISQAPGPGRGP